MRILWIPYFLYPTRIQTSNLFFHLGGIKNIFAEYIDPKSIQYMRPLPSLNISKRLSQLTDKLLSTRLT